MKTINSKKIQRIRENDHEHFEFSAIEFISIGIACHALCLIDHVGILKKLQEDGIVPEKEILSFKNVHLIKAAFVTLIDAKVICLNDRNYILSALGKRLAKNIGLITVPLNGYRKLFSKQFKLLNNPSVRNSDIDFGALALASIDFGANEIDPLILDIFRTMKPKGTICDLGCGTGERLVQICKALNLPGLGIEQSDQAILRGQKYIKNGMRIEIVQGDITNLNEVWEDVDTVTMSFVCHDISSYEMCIRILRSFQNNFPRMKHLIVVDIVSFSEKVPSIMPGFDYVHGLQGMTPRNYEETVEVFKKANYFISNEIQVPNMPNTFIWILKPNAIK